MMRMEHRLVQSQTQRLMLTQKMQQALQILQYSGLELDQYVQQELETNPVLELTPQLSEDEAPVSISDGTGHDGSPFEDTAFDLDDFASRWEQRAKEGRDFSINPEMAGRRDHYVNSITKDESFSSRMLTQLRLAFEGGLKYDIGERIVGEMDDRGYVTGSLESIAEEMDIELHEVERVLYRIQRFEPTGVGARDVVECLLLQLNVEFPNEPRLRVLVENHLEDLQRRQIPKIAKAMGILPEEVEDLKDLLSTLNPWPGHEFASEPTQYIAADLIVEKMDGEFVVYLSGDTIPELTINGHYHQLSRDKTIRKEEKSYLRQKVESARWLIRNIEQRQQTILKIGIAIMEVQHDFLEKGVEEIKPLTLQEIADKVGVHEATVSRTTRGKYVQTPQGLFELKYFFSPGLSKTNGDAQSSRSVQTLVKKIIGEENKRKPLSDQKVADLLKDQGLKIARRTVTKYREALSIPSTTLRREY